MLVALLGVKISAVPDSSLLNVQYFKNNDELLQSLFWKRLQLRKTAIPQTQVYVNDTGTVYQFLERKPSSWNPFSSRRQKVELLETCHGPHEEMQRNNIPISPCVISSLSSENMTYSYSFGLELTFELSFGPSATYMYDTTALGGSIMANVGLLSTGISHIGGIKCQPSSNKSVQIFANINLRYFPEAKSRETVYDFKTSKFEPKEWVEVNTKFGEKETPGALFYDLTKIPTLECVTVFDEKQCQGVINLMDPDWWQIEADSDNE